MTGTGTRVATAIVLLVAFAADLFYAPLDVFALVLGLVVAASAWEWSRLAGIRHEHVQTAYGALVGLVALVCLYLPLSEAFVRWIMLGGLLFWLSVPAAFYLAPIHPPIERADPVLLVAGACLFVVAALAMQYLHSQAPHASPFLLLYALGIVWLMDIGAYFAGRRFGRRKLAPLISPGKTWEGVWGGAAVTAAVLVAVLIGGDWLPGDAARIAIATLVAAAASVVGDLYESRLKRAAGRKDSSTLLPGHGGVLDRIDGLLAALPLFAFVWAWTA